MDASSICLAGEAKSSTALEMTPVFGRHLGSLGDSNEILLALRTTGRTWWRPSNLSGAHGTRSCSWLLETRRGSEVLHDSTAGDNCPGTMCSR